MVIAASTLTDDVPERLQVKSAGRNQLAVAARALESTVIGSLLESSQTEHDV